MKTIAKLTAVLLVAAVGATWPVMAQPDATAPSTNAPAAPKAPRALPFRGTIATVDSTNMVLMLKGRGSNPGTKVKVTSATKIKKESDPAGKFADALFADAVAGMRVQGSGKKGDDGVITANTLNISKPPAPKPATPATPAAPAAPGK